MLLSSDLSRGSTALAAPSALKNLQRPILSSQFRCFVHESPKKLVTNDGSMLHRSRQNFNAFHRFGISSPDPSVKQNAKPRRLKSKESDSVLGKLCEEIDELIGAQLKDYEGVNDFVNAEISKYGALLSEEIEAGLKLLDELEHLPLGKILSEVENSSKLDILDLLKALLAKAKTKSDKSKDKVASLRKELELARKHFSDVKPKFEDSLKGLELKVDELLKELDESHQFEQHK